MKLSELRSAMKRYATRFDAELVSPRDAARVVEDAAAIKNMAATVEALAAARAAETDVWRDDGDRSPAHALARKTGTSVGDAQKTLDAGRKMKDLPATNHAAKNGELSPQQASAITDAASADPDAETRLLDRAKSGSLRDLRDECARTKANACDREERRRRIHAGRHLRTWTDTDGAGHLHLRDNPERIAHVMATVTPLRDRLASEAQARGCPEPLDAHAADAIYHFFCDRAERQTAKTTSTKILVRIDFDALLRGVPADDETCEIAGYGPVAVSAIRDMIATGDPFLVDIITKGKDVVGVAHLGRRPNAHQCSALEWLYPTCAAEGCSSLTCLEFDHREDWAKTHLTVFDLLDRLCHHHHGLKTTDGWGLVDGRGKRAFVPPDDPRHPRHAKRHAAA